MYQVANFTDNDDVKIIAERGALDVYKRQEIVCIVCMICLIRRCPIRYDFSVSYIGVTPLTARNI